LYSTDNKLFMHVPRNINASVLDDADTLVRLVNDNLSSVFPRYWRTIQPRHIP